MTGGEVFAMFGTSDNDDAHIFVRPSAVLAVQDDGESKAGDPWAVLLLTNGERLRIASDAADAVLNVETLEAREAGGK